MAVAAWLQVAPVILLLLGARTAPLSLFSVGPAPVAAAERSKWHIPIPSVSVHFRSSCDWRNEGWGYGGLRGP